MQDKAARERQREEARRFLERLKTEAAAKGVRADVLERATRDFSADDSIVELNASQPEHTRTAGEYVALLVSETRLTAGRAKLAEHATLLERIEAAYGVDRHVVLAIWGIESAFGTSMGERSVVRSLSTLAMTDARRAAFWQGELLAALSILQRGDITADLFVGSWAGAMGHTQFMPSTYLQHAVDFNGDGRRDIWGTPDDALASAANYLKASGWVKGEAAVVEVLLPVAFDVALSDPAVIKSGTEWAALGLKAAREGATPGALATSSLILPAGHTGPAFLVGANFKAILRYNRAVPYALAVSLLAQRLAGGQPLVAAWPVGETSLSRGEREELQTRLAALGHEVGGIDGIIGTQTRQAIRAFQRTAGMPPDGHPDRTLLQRLRSAATPSP